MKNLIICFFALLGTTVFAQTNYSKIPLKTAADCKAAEPSVLTAAAYILSKPMDSDSVKDARAFIIVWMTNTEYSFQVDAHIGNLDKKKNGNLLFIFMACQAKFLLENKDKAKDSEAINVGAYTMLADYISNSANGVTITKDVQKLLDAKRDGKVAEWYKSK